MALQAGFVGCGNITDTHVRAAREAGVGVAAFHGRDPAKAEAMASRYGGRAFARYQEFLAHRPRDMVVIGTPSALHAEQGIAAAERGLHVLVEKPIDVTLEKGRSLVAACERAGVRLGVLFQDRLKPDLVRLKDFVAKGGLG
jgi:predicted dehydrogenase